MKVYNLCFLGFGNVGRALARLLTAKSAELRELYGIEWRVTGVASRGKGWVSKAVGFDVSSLLASDFNDQCLNASRASGVSDWLRKAEPDVVFETTSLNPETG